MDLLVRLDQRVKSTLKDVPPSKILQLLPGESVFGMVFTRTEDGATITKKIWHDGHVEDGIIHDASLVFVYFDNFVKTEKFTGSSRTLVRAHVNPAVNLDLLANTYQQLFG